MLSYLYYRTERVGVAVRLQICMCEVLGSNTDCSDCFICGFLQSIWKTRMWNFD
jgi:hypothetical protein